MSNTDAIRNLVNSALDGVNSSMSPEEAFYTILAAAVVADGEVLDVETEERDALVHRSKLLHKRRQEKPAEFEKMRLEVNERLRDGAKVTYLVIDAARSLRATEKTGEAMAWSAFAHATDIVFADSKVVEKELEFLTTLAGSLGLEETALQEILGFMRKKNAY